MCTPLAIGGLVLTGASIAANQVAQSNVSSARNDALEAERVRQAGFDKQAQAVNTGAQDRYKDFGAQQDTKAQSLASFYKDQTANTAAATPQAAPPSSSNITIQEQAKQQGKSADYSNQQADALGNLQAFGNLFGDIGRSQARDATTLGQIGDFKKGSSGVLPYELEAANGAGGTMGFLGDVLGGLGQAGVSAGLAGSFGGAGAKPLISGLPAASKVGAQLAPSAATFGAGNLYTLY